MADNLKTKQTIETGKHINWFPGHMKKGTDEISEKLKNVDLVIEIVDARAPFSSSNNELQDLIKNKCTLKIALKSDYAIINKNDDINYLSLFERNLRNKVIDLINAKLSDKFLALKRKGLVNPKFLVMVIGLPNVGKSSIINALRQKKTLIVENRPGVTKNQRVVPINNNLFLIDTPGILLKHINDIETAYKLTLINCIKKEVISLEQVLIYGFNYFYSNHRQEFLNYYNIGEVKDYYEFQDVLCRSRNWILGLNKIDLNRFETNIFNDFSLSKICKVNFDR